MSWDHCILDPCLSEGSVVVEVLRIPNEENPPSAMSILKVWRDVVSDTQQKRTGSAVLEFGNPQERWSPLKEWRERS